MYSGESPETWATQVLGRERPRTDRKWLNGLWKKGALLDISEYGVSRLQAHEKDGMRGFNRQLQRHMVRRGISEIAEKCIGSC